MINDFGTNECIPERSCLTGLRYAEHHEINLKRLPEGLFQETVNVNGIKVNFCNNIMWATWFSVYSHHTTVLLLKIPLPGMKLEFRHFIFLVFWSDSIWVTFAITLMSDYVTSSLKGLHFRVSGDVFQVELVFRQVKSMARSHSILHVALLTFFNILHRSGCTWFFSFLRQLIYDVTFSNKC